MKQKELSDVIERNQIQMIKEAAAVQASLPSVLEQYTEQIETREYETHTTQTSMQESTERIEVVEHTILPETEYHTVEQKLQKMMRKL